MLYIYLKLQIINIQIIFSMYKDFVIWLKYFITNFIALLYILCVYFFACGWNLFKRINLIVIVRYDEINKFDSRSNLCILSEYPERWFWHQHQKNQICHTFILVNWIWLTKNLLPVCLVFYNLSNFVYHSPTAISHWTSCPFNPTHLMVYDDLDYINQLYSRFARQCNRSYQQIFESCKVSYFLQVRYTKYLDSITDWVL